MRIHVLWTEFEADDLLYIFVAYVAGMLASALIGTGLLLLMGIESGTDAYIVYSPLLAGIVELILTKLVPAVAILHVVRLKREDLLQPLHAYPFLIGAYGGACVGIIEAVGKLTKQTGMYAGADSISLPLVLAVFLHVLYGGIIGNAVFRDEESRPWHNTITATALVILVHFSWNASHVLELLIQA